METIELNIALKKKEEQLKIRYAQAMGHELPTNGVGKDLPLVLVHGTTADHRRWAPVLPMFE